MIVVSRRWQLSSLARPQASRPSLQLIPMRASRLPRTEFEKGNIVVPGRPALHERQMPGSASHSTPILVADIIRDWGGTGLLAPAPRPGRIPVSQTCHHPASLSRTDALDNQPCRADGSGYRRRLTGRRTSPETRGTARWRCSAIQRRPANSSLTVIAARWSTSHPRQGCGPVSAVPEAIASRHVLGRYNGQVGRLSQGHLPLVQIASIGRAL